MAKTSTILTDVANGVWHDSWSLDASRGPVPTGATGWSIQKRTLRGGLSDGVDVIEFDNGALTLKLLPTRGMGIWNAACGDIELGWKSPVALPVNPAYVNQESRSGLGWLSGFNELLCRCGLASNGPPGVDVQIDDAGNRSETPLTLHGLIANTPAHYVEVSVNDDGPGTLSVTGIVDESSMFGSHLRLKSTLTTTAGTNCFSITDEITNLAASPAEVELLYHTNLGHTNLGHTNLGHTNLGRPLLEEGARFAMPCREVVPRDQRAAEGIGSWQTYGPPETGFAEQVYFVVPVADDDGNTIALLHNAVADRGVSLAYNVGTLPCFTLWKNTQAEADGYVTGLEPSTDYPNSRTFERERQRLITLPPGGSHVTSLQIAVQTTGGQVARVQQQIAGLQADVAPTLHSQPQPTFSPIAP